MSNVVDFPVADRPITEDQIDKLHSQAFRDLESRICDCVCMVKIAARAVMNIRTDDCESVFAAAHASEMLDTLKVDYYAAWHGEKPIEP